MAMTNSKKCYILYITRRRKKVTEENSVLIEYISILKEETA